MRLVRLLNRKVSKTKRTQRVSSQSSHPPADAFVLESLEERLLLSAAPVPTTEVPTTQPAQPAAVVTTNKADYSPGETAVITTSNTEQEGAKFAEGETVEFQVTRTDGVEDFPMGNLPWYVTDGVGGFEAYQDYDPITGQAVDRNADGQADWIRPDNDGTVNGSISTTWFVEDQYLGATLQLTATGQTAGAVATTQFTDSPRVGSVVVDSQGQQVTTGVGGTTQYTFNVFRGNNNNNTAGATVAITGLPTGVTVTGLTTSITLAATNNETTSAYTGTFSLNVPTGLAANSYNFNVTVTATQGGGNDTGSGTGTLVVSPATVATTTTVQSSSSTSTYGDAVTFTATVARTSGTGTPTGSLNFTIQGIGTVAGIAGPTTATTATWTYTTTTSALTAGNHTVSASFTGTGSFVNSSGSLTGGQTVNQKTVTATIIGNPTKPYDGNTNATLTALNFSLSGLVGTEGFTVTKTSGTYNSKDVATANTVSTTLAGGDFTADSGTLASNYILPTTASGAGHITRATLTGLATTQSALNIAKQGALVFSLDSITGMVDGDTVVSLLSSMSFTLTIGANTYAFAPSVAIDTHGDLNPSNDTVVVTYSLKNGGDAGQLALDLQALNLSDGTASTSASNAQVAAIFVNMSTANYTFSDDALTRLFYSSK